MFEDARHLRYSTARVAVSMQGKDFPGMLGIHYMDMNSQEAVLKQKKTKIRWQGRAGNPCVTCICPVLYFHHSLSFLPA